MDLVCSAGANYWKSICLLGKLTSINFNAAFVVGKFYCPISVAEELHLSFVQTNPFTVFEETIRERSYIRKKMAKASCAMSASKGYRARAKS